MTAWSALFWGLFSGSGLLVGTAIASFSNPTHRTIATTLAFASGLIVSTIAFELMADAFTEGGLIPTSFGFLGGAAIYTVVSIIVQRAWHGGDEATSFQIFAGTIIHGIPEFLVIGVALIEGIHVALTAIVAIFIANWAEALSSSAEMKKAGRTMAFVFILWAFVTANSGVFAFIGFVAFDHTAHAFVAVVEAVAAGALLAMIADTMIPEAFAETRQTTGLMAAAGFVVGYALAHSL
jgi:ZIP family zinc transporter